MLNLRSEAYTIRNGGEGQFEFFSDISTRTLETVRIGEGAGKISTGSGNAFVGYESGKINQKGSFGAFVGFQAGALNQNGNFCTFVGAFSGKENRRGDANTFVGFRAGELNKDGSECVAIGAFALRENYSGNRTVAVGYRAGERTLDADFNTIIGAEAGQDNRSGNYNTMAGFRSGRAAFRGNENTYFGAYAGYSNSFGDGNAFVGFKAGEYLTLGNYNVAIGAYALQKTTFGSSNIAIGAFSGTFATGSGNLFVGTRAGSSNTTGNNSVFLGTESGSIANGSENVYIGKSAASNMNGDRNVIIGAYTLMDFQANGTVAIGYRIGENFLKGNSNVFIGYEVDTHSPYNSYGVAIGTRNVKTYHHAIAVGENLNNSGLASVIIGRDIVNDAENSVSIGNDIDISSVYVLSDPLDYRSPVSQSKTYGLFNVQEYYSDTIYNGTQSNTSATFSVNNLNIFNSGTNRPQGFIPDFDTNLTNLFKFHVGYQGDTEIILSEPIILDNIFEYINNPNNIRKKNFETINLSTGVVEITAEQKKTKHNVNVNFFIPESIYNEPYDSNTLIGLIGVNLIRKENQNELLYSFYYPKRMPIYQINNTQPVVLENSFDYIRTTCNIDAWQFQSNIWTYDLSTDGYDTVLYNNTLSNIIIEHPKYGVINRNLFGDSNIPLIYSIYPESLFASNDSLIIASARTIDEINILSDHPKQINIYSSNTHYFNSNAISLHPIQPIYLDQSHILRKPLYSPTQPVSINIGPNIYLEKSGVPYTNTTVSALYSDFIQQSITIRPTDSNQSIFENIRMTIGTTEYPSEIYYDSTSNYLKEYSQASNIYINLLTSNVLVPINLPSISIDSIYIRKQPSYGVLSMSMPVTNLSNIAYQPLHPYNEDTAEVLIKYYLGDRITYKLLNILFLRNSTHYSIPVYKLHETSFETTLDVQFSLINSKYSSNLLTNIYNDQYTVSVINGVLPTKIGYSKQYTCNITNYDSVSGYVYQSNIQLTDRFTRIDYDSGFISALIKSRIPTPTPWNGIACNIYYYQYTGINPITNPINNGSFNLHRYYFYNSLQQPYYFYGLTAPYYEYEELGMGTSHIYWQYIKQVKHDTYTKYACNVDIVSCNETYFLKDYYTLNTSNYLFQSNVSTVLNYAPTSNYIYIPSTNQPQTMTSTSNYVYTILTNSYIPTYSLRNVDLYQKNGQYTYQSTNKFLNIIEKNKGLATYFHQSNIDRDQIYIWLSSNLPNNKPFEYHRLYLSNDRAIEYNYYNNIALDSSPGQIFNFSVSNYLSQTIDGQSNGLNFTSQEFTFIAIQSISSNIFVKQSESKYEMTNKIHYPNTYLFIPLVKEPVNLQSQLQQQLQTFYVSTTQNKAKTLLTSSFQYNSYLSQKSYLNTRLADSPNYLTSNNLHYYDTTIPSSNLIYHIVSYCNDISRTLFNQKDIDDQKIYVSHSNITHFSIQYDLYNQTDYLTSGEIPIQTYGQTIFPPRNFSLVSCNEIVNIQNIFEHNRIGPFWNYIEQSLYYQSNIQSNELSVYITKQPTKGYFYSSNSASLLNTNVISKINYHDFKTHKLHYIPYIPNDLSNDSYQFYLDYKGDISDIYETNLKNYWSQFSPFLVDSRPYNNTYIIDTSNIPRSYGLIQDGYTWSCNDTQLFIKNYSLEIQKEFKQFTQRPYFKSAQITETIDIGGYFNFKRLLNTSNTISSNSRDLHFFVSSNPSYGKIMKKNDDVSLPYISDPYFTYSDIVGNKVFYHHYGENEVTDGFKLLIGSAKLTNSDGSVYDISEIPIEYRVTISSKSSLIKNNPDYIYKETSNEIINSSNLINTSLIDINKGNVIIYSTCNLDIYRKNGIQLEKINYFTQAQLISNEIYYKINSNIFRNNSNLNESMNIQFIVSSSNTTIEDIDPISTLSYYRGLYLQEWDVNLNNYVSSNIIQKHLNSNQIVQYYKKSYDNQYFNFDNRRIQIDFTLNPEQQQLYTDTVFNHKKYLNQLETFKFNFNIYDQSSNVLLNAHFTKNKVIITNSIQTQKTLTIPIIMNERNNISFILNDDRNNNNLSFYINNINYLNGAGYPFIVPNSSNIRTFALQADILDPFNYYNYTLTSNISKDVYLYYNLTNFTNKLKFNDFNILVNTYDLSSRDNTSNEEYIFSSNLNNVIIGKLLDVKGLNNICIGQNFKTIGTDSIILGNNIGVDNSSSGTNTLNEIFQSIVIANNSFVNSKVRDVIAIGNNILTNIPFDLTNFLLKKPILIGNDIGIDLIDFHINIQNTFLKTTEAPVPAIYLGSTGDIVAIGYSNNQKFNNDYQLYVNGGISYNGNFTAYGSLIHTRKIFGNLIYTSGTSHTCTIRISWTNEQLDDYNAFTISGKFRGLLSDSVYIYRRFETWVTPKNDDITSKPKGLTDFEIASYASVGITDYEHSVVRYDTKSVNLAIAWTTVIDLNDIDKMIAHLDLEVAYPQNLGTLTMQIL